MSTSSQDPTLRNRLVILQNHKTGQKQNIIQLLAGRVEIGQLSLAPASIEALDIRHPDPRDLEDEANYEILESTHGRRIATPKRHFNMPEVTLVLRCEYEVRTL